MPHLDLSGGGWWLEWALIVGLTVANIMDHKAQLQNMAIEEVFRHQMGGVERCDPLRLRVEENQEEVYGRFYGG